MHILRLTTYLEGGGAEASIHDYAKELSKKHTYAIMFFEGSDNKREELEKHGVRVIRSSFSLGGIAKAMAYINIYKPDIVHATLYKAEIVGTILKIMYGKPFVVNRDSDIWRITGKKVFYDLADNILHKYFIYLLADKIVAITHHVKSHLCKKLKIPLSKVEVVYYGMNKTLSSVKHKNHSNPRIIFVGRLEEQKGVDVFLKVILKTKPKRKAEMHIYGRGFYEKIFKELNNKTINNFSIYYHGFEPNIKKIYAHADIMFLPTQFEGFGLVFLEALSTKHVVVLTSKIKPLDEVLNSHAIFCHPKDIECFSIKLNDIINNLQKYRKNVYKGIDKHLQKFSIERVSKKLEEIYNDLIS